ncbi:MAG: hypothetical protein JRI95_14985, partial [Deltaproteobacteria bacterium]|nr:hypothetical protein [Deltaproteobacteria bacterium]
MWQTGLRSNQSLQVTSKPLRAFAAIELRRSKDNYPNMDYFEAEIFQYTLIKSKLAFVCGQGGGT